MGLGSSTAEAEKSEKKRMKKSGTKDHHLFEGSVERCLTLDESQGLLFKLWDELEVHKEAWEVADLLATTKESELDVFNRVQVRWECEQILWDEKIKTLI
ncbi:uncharacterized protein A4U43_C01F16850 [Asparagus officinalis]|uniref:Uncharacterized protein n=1 Tax=Asparagus officinalis TaxID=4686 RepID=A0A5P1FRN4_ASPOF|nr:uncharacterized protein A4U43_C01F16850 [Asparagus officinalis]